MDKVLCGANAQSMKYYFNEEQFGKLPKAVKDELKLICVSYCADVGGAFTISFNADGALSLQTIAPIDEIGAELRVKKLQEEQAELFAQLERFNREIADKAEKQ